MVPDQSFSFMEIIIGLEPKPQSLFLLNQTIMHCDRSFSKGI